MPPPWRQKRSAITPGRSRSAAAPTTDPGGSHGQSREEYVRSGHRRDRHVRSFLLAQPEANRGTVHPVPRPSVCRPVHGKAPWLHRSRPLRRVALSVRHGGLEQGGGSHCAVVQHNAGHRLRRQLRRSVARPLPSALRPARDQDGRSVPGHARRHRLRQREQGGLRSRRCRQAVQRSDQARDAHPRERRGLGVTLIDSLCRQPAEPTSKPTRVSWVLKLKFFFTVSRPGWGRPNHLHYFQYKSDFPTCQTSPLF